MSEFVLHEHFHHFLFSPFVNTFRRPHLKVNNIKIEQYAAIPKAKQKQKIRNEIREHERIISKNERTVLINRTIDLIYDKNRPRSQASQYRRKSISSMTERHSKIKGHSLSNSAKYQDSESAVNEEQKIFQDKQYLSNVFKTTNYKLAKQDKQKIAFNRYETQVLSVDLKRKSDNESNYARFAQRNIKRLEQRHRRYANNANKKRPGQISLRTEKKHTEMLQPW